MKSFGKSKAADVVIGTIQKSILVDYGHRECSAVLTICNQDAAATNLQRGQCKSSTPKEQAN